MFKLDFTIETLEELYKTLISYNYNMVRFSDFLAIGDKGKFCILRHDIDRAIESSLTVAKVEKALGINASYFFRYSKHLRADVIREIERLGHEVGYHYEALSKAKGDYQLALELFNKELEDFRKIVPISVVSAHGSPLSKWENRKLFSVDNLKRFDIVGDASFSINFDEVLYLTDTGRSWNRNIGNIRDKVSTKYNYNFFKTSDIVNAIKKEELPDKIMLSIHPCRWKSNAYGWVSELILQSFKNMCKTILLIKQ